MFAGGRHGAAATGRVASGSEGTAQSRGDTRLPERARGQPGRPGGLKGGEAAAPAHQEARHAAASAADTGWLHRILYWKICKLFECLGYPKYSLCLVG